MISEFTLIKSKHYNSLENIHKKILLKKNNRDKITLGINMSKLQSFEFWVEKCNPTERIKNIVKELINTQE